MKSHRKLTGRVYKFLSRSTKTDIQPRINRRQSLVLPKSKPKKEVETKKKYMKIITIPPLNCNRVTSKKGKQEAKSQFLERTFSERSKFNKLQKQLPRKEFLQSFDRSERSQMTSSKSKFYYDKPNPFTSRSPRTNTKFLLESKYLSSKSTNQIISPIKNTFN